MTEYEAGICEALGTGRLVSIEPEAVTKDLLRKTGQHDAFPVDLAPILRRLEVERVEADLEGDGYLLRLPSGRFEMLVRTGEPTNRNRQRFTIAHEMGHFYSEKLDATQDDHPTKFKVDDAPQPKVERWCDSFASSLLMPAEAVSRALGGPNGLLDATKVEATAEAFQVSLEAFCYRAAQLFRAVLATTNPEGTHVLRLSPQYLDTENHRPRVQSALEQQVDRGNASARIIGGRALRFHKDLRTVFGYKARAQ